MADLPPFEELETALAAELQIVHEYVRPGLLFRIYELAKRKLEMERLRENDIDEVPRIRKSIRNHAKILTQIRRAMECIEIAKKEAEAEDTELLRQLDVIEAQRLLGMAAADIIWLKDQLLPGSIHPDLRSKAEEATVHKAPAPVYSKSQFPGFGCSQVEHWFIGELDRCLDTCITRAGEKVTVGRDKLIKKVLEVAFPAGHRTLKSINTTRQRMKAQRKE